MPRCFCVAYGCGSSGDRDPISQKPLGKNVDPRTFKSHTLADRGAAFRAAEENTNLWDGSWKEDVKVWAGSGKENTNGRKN